MAANLPASGVIEPHLVYDVEAAARALNKTPRWVDDNLLRNNAIPYFRRGEYRAIPGYILIHWTQSDLRTHSEWLEKPEGPEAPQTSPKSASKRSS